MYIYILHIIITQATTKTTTRNKKKRACTVRRQEKHIIIFYVLIKIPFSSPNKMKQSNNMVWAERRMNVVVVCWLWSPSCGVPLLFSYASRLNYVLLIINHFDSDDVIGRKKLVATCAYHTNQIIQYNVFALCNCLCLSFGSVPPSISAPAKFVCVTQSL